jgi:hypothetical protein
MIKQILLAALAGGAIVFVLSAIFNSVRIAGAHPVSLPVEAEVLPALRASIPKSGVYFFPGVTSSAGMTKEQKVAWQADYNRRYREGPTGIVSYSTGGKEFSFSSRLVVQFLIGFFASLAAAVILSMTASATGYSSRVASVVLMGMFAFVYIEPQYWNWYDFPAKYTAVRVLGGVITWAMAGLAMAGIVH